jgi:hypothetical protein
MRRGDGVEWGRIMGRARKYAERGRGEDRGLGRLKKDAILERDCYICAYCDGIADCVDHVVPYSYSQCNDEYNLVACCSDCNLIALDKVFSSFGEKRLYIQGRRSGKKWARKINSRYCYCSICKKSFSPSRNGATNLICKECMDEERVL